MMPTWVGPFPAVSTSMGRSTEDACVRTWTPRITHLSNRAKKELGFGVPIYCYATRMGHSDAMDEAYELALDRMIRGPRKPDREAKAARATAGAWNQRSDQPANSYGTC
jgi:hypothetical protein